MGSCCAKTSIQTVIVHPKTPGKRPDPEEKVKLNSVLAVDHPAPSDKSLGLEEASILVEGLSEHKRPPSAPPRTIAIASPQQAFGNGAPVPAVAPLSPVKTLQPMQGVPVSPSSSPPALQLAHPPRTAAGRRASFAEGPVQQSGKVAAAPALPLRPMELLPQAPPPARPPPSPLVDLMPPRQAEREPLLQRPLDPFLPAPAPIRTHESPTKAPPRAKRQLVQERSRSMSEPRGVQRAGAQHGDILAAPAPAPARVSTPEHFSFGDGRIRVCVRKRPLNSREAAAGAKDVVHVMSEHQLVVIEPKVRVDLTTYSEEHPFIFDEGIDAVENNAAVYRRVLAPLLAKVLADGGRGSCFAYGQTGSGKTHTLMGGAATGGDPSERGLFELAAADLYGQPAVRGLAVAVSFFEVYGSGLFDLLNKREKLVTRDDGTGSVVVVGLSERAAGSCAELLALQREGLRARSVGATGANDFSSRSHAILQLTLRDGAGQEKGRLSIIDLAGNERGADTIAKDRRTRQEGAEINKSLLALKECIRALHMQRPGAPQHVPFRGSVLTTVLKDSFVGQAATVMIACCSPSSSNIEFTLNTLRYADRVKDLRIPRPPSPNRRAMQPMELRRPPRAPSMPPQPSPSLLAGPGEERPPSAPPRKPRAFRIPVPRARSEPRMRPPVAPPVAHEPQLAALAEKTPSRSPSKRLTPLALPPRPPVPAAEEGPGPLLSPIAEAHGEASQRSVAPPRTRPRTPPRDAAPPRAAPQQPPRTSPVPGPRRRRDEPAASSAEGLPRGGRPPLPPSGSGRALLAPPRPRGRGGLGEGERAQLLAAHRAHVDLCLALQREGTEALAAVDRPGGSIDAYVTAVDAVASRLTSAILALRSRLALARDCLDLGVDPGPEPAAAAAAPPAAARSEPLSAARPLSSSSAPEHGEGPHPPRGPHPPHGPHHAHLQAPRPPSAPLAQEVLSHQAWPSVHSEPVMTALH